MWIMDINLVFMDESSDVWRFSS